MKTNPDTKDKKEVQSKVLKLVREALDQNKILERHHKAYGEQLGAFMKELSQRISTQVINQVPSELVIKNLNDELLTFAKQFALLNEKGAQDISAAIIKSVNARPEWADNLVKKLNEKHDVEVKNIVKVKEDGTIAGTLTALFASLAGLLVRLANRTVSIMGKPEHYTTPQFVMIVDPASGRPVRPDEIGKAPIPGAGFGGTAIAASGGPTHVGARGANSFNDGQKAVTTAGTPVQLAADTECSRVVIQAHPANVGDIVIGGASVVAASGTRRGLSLYGSQWAEFKVANLNQIWLDATSDGDKVNYFYEA